ncbi:gastrula zinc finger protein XlCGF8.2DB-like [Xiphias gladius]|uniref:gastrula zinc finger protein XlCGF8.2DB-like n=1 Tax=Xiphias gladius TaxID=8245 RepID=UPI001A994A89|nr:gastrula zinc finger protein XlCGF8.2DB-like [Xiphias gladius]
MRSHTGERPYSCSVCGIKFRKKGNLSYQMLIHTGVKPFCCSVCGKKFRQKGNLSYQMLIHTGVKPFCCSVCGKTFRHKSPLKYHMLTHTTVKPLSCSLVYEKCRNTTQHKNPKCVGESSQLHSGKSKKPLSCSKCDETFPNTARLMIHMRKHKGKKLFTCTVCGQQLLWNCQLKIHMRSHTGERPYSCSVCGKKFSQTETMMHHMAVHSGLHQSQTEEQITARRESLSLNMMCRTGEKSLRCSVCNTGFSESAQKEAKQEELQPPRIKEEQEEVGGLEPDITKFPFNPGSMKSEDDEEKPQTSQLHQSQTEENKEAEPPASSSTEQMETEADGEDCGGPEPARNSNPDTHLQPDADDKISVQLFQK